MHVLWCPTFPLWQFVVRGLVVYFAILLLIRIGGKRQIGQLGTGEFVAILLISNAVQNAMNGGDNSITGGLILAVVLIVASYSIDYITFRSKTAEKWIQGVPTLLIHHGQLIRKNLTKELLNVDELKTALRRQNIQALEDVAEAILESNGSLTVVRKTDLAHGAHSATLPSK